MWNKLKAGMRSQCNKARLVGGSLVMLGATSVPAFAQAGGTIDTTTVLASIAGAAAAVLAVGAAVTAGPKIGVKVYKWLDRAL